MDAKDRVKLNVYKELLKEEKSKNKKVLVVGASMFVMGIFSGNVAEMALTSTKTSEVAMKQDVIENDIVWENFFEENNEEKKTLDLKDDDLFVLDFGI